ncbi:MAG: NAD-dependent epimerase/dehydratase family protein, partial [Clostridia bacterium]|nr:NAD-dependent epimerase/dehydratase family protein [Clostridia bacterium]
MKTILVTGGTVFVSRYAAEYFQRRGWQVSVLNRGTRQQVEGVELIRADRHALGEKLRQRHFDAVLDVTAYTAEDVNALPDALGGYGQYVLISSSAVYPETETQPFREDAAIGPNVHWGRYGTDKIAAEQALHARDADAYILRPPYLYGTGNNVYREAFVFDCALADRAFFLPGEGQMQLHFLHVDDLCRFAELLLETRPAQRIFNVGNPETVSIHDWVTACYVACGKTPDFVPVSAEVEQRQYFPFYNYEYALDVSAQCALMGEFIPLQQ